MISAIVAVDDKFGIGFNGQLLEHIPEDLKFFKEKTEGNVVVMGRKTWESLPKKPLPDRTNIVITNSLRERDCLCVTLNHAKLIMKQQSKLDFFVIGGGQIYEKLLPMCDTVYLTHIHKDYENVDTYFPNLDKMPEWQLVQESELKKYNDISYQFKTYCRIS